jgi:Flp pilus assembly pilin Flp
MEDVTQMLAKFHEDESGATATEYVILLILIACFVIAIVNLFGKTISSKFTTAKSAVQKQVTF